MTDYAILMGSCTYIEAILKLCVMGLDVFYPTGERLFLHCEAIANCEDDLTIIYWLVNGSFPEETSSTGRIVESEE